MESAVYPSNLHMRTFSLCLLALFVPSFAGTLADARAAVEAAGLHAIDINKDGYPEIRSLQRIEEKGKYPYESPANGPKGTILVLVESRLLTPLRGARSLERSIQGFVRDLSGDGYNAMALSIQLEEGTRRRQGGRTLLAVRHFLQSVFNRVPDLKGAILIGRFPNAFIVRQHFWERDDDTEIAGKKISGRHWVVSYPEPVATSADIVLADMDGKWDSVYQEESKPLPYFRAAFPAFDTAVATKDYETGTKAYSDFFFVQDGGFRAETADDGMRFIRTGPLDSECSNEDKKLPNPMCRAEIAVSRIDASLVAFRPDPSLVDGKGRPKAVNFASGKVPNANKRWTSDPSLERELLYEFFTRDHAYRNKGVPDGWAPANYSTEWDSSVPALKQSVKPWNDLDTKGLDVVGSHANLNDWVAWMKRPAFLRAIKAHTSPWGSEYGRPKDDKALLDLTGPAWGWQVKGDTLELADFEAGFGEYQLYRTLYENKVLPPTPNLFMHTGCDSITPPYFDRYPFGDDRYGRYQGAEALLMFCNGLVLLGRGKVFNDEPANWEKLLAEGKTWGEVWQRYFDADGNDARENKDNGIGIRRKKAYFWSLIGDWTLTIYPPGR